MKRWKKQLLILTWILPLVLCAAVPELEKLVPEATGYELIYRFNPLEFAAKGYLINQAGVLCGELRRIGYLLKLTDRQNTVTWVFVTMKPFTQNLHRVGVPHTDSGVIQEFVEDMEVFSNLPGVETGKFARGNLEFWNCGYTPENSKKIPGATSQFDFGDTPVSPTVQGYGSMQVHNYGKEQTVFSFSNFRAQNKCDLGIGSNLQQTPGEKDAGAPDWTFSQAGTQYKNAELFVVGQFNNLKIRKIVPLEGDKITFKGKCERDRALYLPGEKMQFFFTVNLGGQDPPEKPLLLQWTRSGDDHRTFRGQVELHPDRPTVVTASLDEPGFVRIQAQVTDYTGKTIPTKKNNLEFDGGAGVQIERLRGTVEPLDLDAFWTRQKERLAAIPLRCKMVKISKPGAEFDVYAVAVDCPGPRPVTGYLTIPAGAGKKSLPALALYHGYGPSRQKAPLSGPPEQIFFEVNAHGYELGQTEEYYQKFFKSICSNGQDYGFDPKQNTDPETAYFNGMALRVIRSLEFLQSLEQWDGKNLTVRGASQGGLQALWGGALMPNVSSIEVMIPWCCDLARETPGKLLSVPFAPGLNYYDPIYLAKRIPKTCRVSILQAGLGDYTCPPTGIAILYNQIQAPKMIRFYQGATHSFVPDNPQVFVLEEK